MSVQHGSITLITSHRHESSTLHCHLAHFVARRLLVVRHVQSMTVVVASLPPPRSWRKHAGPRAPDMKRVRNLRTDPEAI